MKIKPLIYFVLFFVWKPILQSLLIITTIAWLKNINLITIILSILTWIYLFKLLFEKPNVKDWLLKTTPTIILTVTILYYLVAWLGAIGVSTTIFVMIGFAAWRIKKNWKVYDAITTWGAKRLFKGSKEDFDLEEAIKK